MTSRIQNRRRKKQQ